MTKSDLRNEMARRIQNSHNSRSVTWMSQAEARRLAQAAMPAVDQYVENVRAHLTESRTTKRSRDA